MAVDRKRDGSTGPGSTPLWRESMFDSRDDSIHTAAADATAPVEMHTM